MALASDRVDELRGWLARLGVENADLVLANQALTHRSSAHEAAEDRGGPDNERLEFLGDAVIGLIVAEHLYETHPSLAEGELTRLKSRLVSRETMGRLAHRLDFGRHLILGKGEEQSGGRERPSILGNALEALVGSVYLTDGLAGARAFVNKLWAEEFPAIDSSPTIDPKSELQEIMQARLRTRPSYQIIGEEGPDHNKEFVARVASETEVLGEGRGRTKKEAEQAAALKALRNWRGRRDGD